MADRVLNSFPINAKFGNQYLADGEALTIRSEVARDASLLSENNSASSEAAANTSAITASDSALSASASATIATAAATDLETTLGLAIVYKNDAQTSSVSASAASASASASSSSSSASASAALASENSAEKWAVEAEDVEVSTGEFSAKHWAAKASTFNPELIIASSNNYRTGLIRQSGFYASQSQNSGTATSTLPPAVTLPAGDYLLDYSFEAKPYDAGTSGAVIVVQVEMYAYIPGPGVGTVHPLADVDFYGNHSIRPYLVIRDASDLDYVVRDSGQRTFTLAAETLVSFKIQTQVFNSTDQAQSVAITMIRAARITRIQELT